MKIISLDSVNFVDSWLGLKLIHKNIIIIEAFNVLVDSSLANSLPSKNERYYVEYGIVVFNEFKSVVNTINESSVKTIDDYEGVSGLSMFDINFQEEFLVESRSQIMGIPDDSNRQVRCFDNLEWGKLIMGRQKKLFNYLESFPELLDIHFEK